MKEYWINVYENHKFMLPCNNLETAKNIIQKVNVPVIYRIHVKMNGGYNRYRKEFMEYDIKKQTVNFKFKDLHLQQPIKRPQWMDRTELKDRWQA